MMWFIIGFISYFILKKIAFNIQTKDSWSSYSEWEDFIKPEKWTYGAAIIAILVCTLFGFVTLVVCFGFFVYTLFNSGTRYKGDHWFNKQSKL